MSHFFSELQPEHAEFIQQQAVFFVGSCAALPGTQPSGEVELARVNVSPKGMDTFRVVSPKEVGYLDLTGSGNETAAHIHADGRVTIMFCSFGPKPLILRIYGRGRVARSGMPAWASLKDLFGTLPGERQIVLIDVESVQTSCGFAVPQFGQPTERRLLIDWAEKKGEESVKAYRMTKNLASIDGLPTGLTPEK